MHFLEWNLLNFKYNFTEIWSLGFSWQYGIIGSDNGLAPVRRQDIILASHGLAYWCMFASLGLNELNVYAWYYQLGTGMVYNLDTGTEHSYHATSVPNTPWYQTQPDCRRVVKFCFISPIKSVVWSCSQKRCVLYWRQVANALRRSTPMMKLGICRPH